MISSWIESEAPAEGPATESTAGTVQMPDAQNEQAVMKNAGEGQPAEPPSEPLASPTTVPAVAPAETVSAALGGSGVQINGIWFVTSGELNEYVNNLKVQSPSPAILRSYSPLSEPCLLTWCYEIDRPREGARCDTDTLVQR